MIAHIQHDFHEAIQDVQEGKLTDDKFYVNVGLESVKDYTFVVDSSGINGVAGTQFSGKGHHWEMQSPEGTFRFYTPLKIEHQGAEIVSFDKADNYTVVARGATLTLYKAEEECQWEHVAEVTKVKFFPSGTVVVSASMDHSLRIWSCELKQCLRVLDGHQLTVTDIGIIEKGRNVVSSSIDGTIRLWECGSGECIDIIDKSTDGVTCLKVSTMPETPMTQPVHKLEFGTHGKVLIAGYQSGKCKIFNLGTREVLHEILGSCAVTSVECSPLFNGTVFIGYEDGTVTCWSNGDTRSLVLEGPIRSMLLADKLYVAFSDLCARLNDDLSVDKYLVIPHEASVSQLRRFHEVVVTASDSLCEF